MLRLGQSTAKISRGVHAAARNDTLVSPSGQQHHGMSMLRALGSCSYRNVGSSDETVSGGGGGSSSSTCCNGKRGDRTTNGSNICASNFRHTFSSVAYRPGMLPAGGASRRLMSTSTGAGNPDALNRGSDEAAAAAADLSPDAMAGASDAAMAAAGTAEQAQAAMEVATPETFKMALYTPPQLAMMAVDSVHAATGMPYWMTIVAITLGIRTVILPVGVLSARSGARTAAMKPEMDALQDAIKNDQQSSQPRKADRYRQETKALYQKYGASPLMSIALPIIQLPLYVGFFLGIRRMADAVPEFATGGTLWFQDLGAPDPLMIFPIVTGATMLAMAELGGEGLGAAGSSIKMKAGMRGMALLAVPFTMNISTGVFVYWTTSNLYSILQTMAFKAPTIKKYLNIPTPPEQKPSSTAAEKELNWFDVLGGSNPIKEYRKMQHQREVQAWYLGGGSGASPTAAGNAGVVESSGSVAREGAPFHAPPPMAHPVRAEGATPVVGAGRPVPAQQSKPQVELRAVRPKPAGNSRNKGKAGARRPGKTRAKA